MSIRSNLRLAIVGCGKHSHVHAAAAIGLSGVDWVAACDIDQERARTWSQKYGCEASYGHLAEMLTHDTLDGIILSTWPNQHAEQIEQCLRAGVKNILCEKALVVSASEARRVARLVRDHDANLVEGSMYRHHPAIRKLERILAYGDIGAIDSIRAAFHNFEPEDALGTPNADNWRNHSHCGGGVPYDWMHYLVDSCNHFSDSLPKRVFASGSRSPHNDVIYRIYALIEYENGTVGIIENSKLANFSNTLELTCAHGTLNLPIAYAIQGEVTITERHRKPDWGYILNDTYSVAEANAFALQLQDFCDVVRGKKAPLLPLKDSIVNAFTTEALVTSLREERHVHLDLTELRDLIAE